MPEKTKITLSDKELSLVKNVDWILTKQVIIQKVYDLFAGKINAIQTLILNEHAVPENVRLSVPKINKGENYLQLPYVIMDYPRCFEKENIFAVRTMFWWGNFFSITLHLSGIYKDFVKANLNSNDEVPQDGLFIGVNENQWQHHFQEDNFMPFTQLSQQQRLAFFEKNNFIKLAIKFNLDEWNEMPELLDEGYKRIATLLLSYPAGEKGL
ncbi:MAG: hypothetical protein ABIN36_19725 [Ferruginibacter sp.]